MKIHNNLKEVEFIKNPVLSIGMFDGVHIGHSYILSLLNQEAKNVDGESVLLTFNPHPRIAINPELKLSFISTNEEKILQLKNNNLQHLIIQPFDKEFSNLSAQEFVVDLLVKKLNIHTLIIGHDHHFGKNREGNFQLLEELSKQYQFYLIQIPAIKNNGIEVSSTKIRNALIEGEIEKANSFLGRPYSFVGTVVNGQKIGRTINFPTANLQIHDDKLLPKNGVYKVQVYLDNQFYKGMLNIGTRPTILENGARSIEVYIFDFSSDIYGQKLEVHFLKNIREEIKFNSLTELKAQLEKDKIACS